MLFIVWAAEGKTDLLFGAFIIGFKILVKYMSLVNVEECFYMTRLSYFCVIIYRTINEMELEGLQSRQLGMMLSTILFKRRPRKFKFIPACVAVEMWRQGVSHKVFKTLNHMGISLSVSAARSHVDNLARHHDDQLNIWKDTLKVKIYIRKQNLIGWPILY